MLGFLRCCRFGAGFALLVTACHRETDEATRAEAGRVARQVQLLRDADNAAKAPPLKALETTACNAADVCALKQTCTGAYALQLSAFDAIASVRHAAGEPGVLPPEAAQLLSRAEADLARASDMTQRCADTEATLRRKYGL